MFSISVTAALPAVNLLGVYVIDFVRLKLRRNEVETCLGLFGIAIACLLGLLFAGGSSLLFTLLAFGVITSCTVGTNTMLVHLVPTYFVKYGRVSTVSEILNACVYVGSSISAYGIGAVADIWGWTTLLICLAAAALIGLFLCAAALPGWAKHARENVSQHTNM